MMEDHFPSKKETSSIPLLGIFLVGLTLVFAAAERARPPLADGLRHAIYLCTPMKLLFIAITLASLWPGPRYLDEEEVEFAAVAGDEYAL
jgi:hypothetical protein